MSITYPISLPGILTGETYPDLVLQSPDLTKWRIFIGAVGGQDGIMKVSSGATGNVRQPVLKAPDNGQWQLTIDNNGIVSVTDTITSSETATAQIPFDSDATGRIWNMIVDNNGILFIENAQDESSAIVSATFRPFSVVAVSESPFTLQQQIQVHQGQSWVITASVGPLDRNDAEEWIAALLSLNGREGVFYFGDPSAQVPRGTVDGTPLVNGGTQTGQQLATRGWTANAESVLKAGDWIQLGAGLTQRIYRVLNPVTADPAGNATIDIWPRLRESPGDGTAIVTRRTKGVFRLATNEMRWDIERVLLYGIDLQAVEAL